ncbi:hypothetical protein H5T88_08015 [bacterium]|nr:hypothetical protein [bacterium]
MKKLLLVNLLVLFIGVAFSAQPTILGYSGLITAPTAETVKMSGVALIASSSKDMNTVGGCAGLIANWEISAARVSNKEAHTLLNGKIGLLQEGLALPSIAVGVVDLSDEIGNSIYAVATKTISITKVATQTAGLPFGSPQISVGIASGKVLDGVFAGIVLPLSQKSRLMAEYANKKVNFGFGTQIFPLADLEVFSLEGDLGAAVYVKLGF